jgi:hypothetical protein
LNSAAVGIGSSRSQVQAGAQFGEHALGEREVAGRQVGGAVRLPRDDRLREPGVLPQGPAAHLRRIRLGVEAEPDLPADAGAEVGQPGIVRGPRDRLVQRVVGQPGRAPVAGSRVVPHGTGDHADVVVVTALRRGPRDQLLDEPAVVQDLGQLFPRRIQRSLDHLVRAGSGPGLDEGPAAAAPPGDHVAAGVQPVQRLPHGRSAHLERRGQLALGRQPLARLELAERDRRHQPVGDPLAGGPHRHRLEQRAERVIAIGSRLDRQQAPPSGSRGL